MHEKLKHDCFDCNSLETQLKRANICKACGSAKLGRNRTLTTQLCAACDTTKKATTQCLVLASILAAMPPPSAVDTALVGGEECNASKRRPDVAWVADDRVVMLEIDEHSHADPRFPREVSCELAKLDSTRFGVSGGGVGGTTLVPVVTVRMNPDECDRAAPVFAERCAQTAALLHKYICCPLSVFDPLRANVHYLWYHSNGLKHIEAARAAKDNVRVLGVD